MFTLTATVQYSLLRKLWSNGVAQEMPRSCLVIHVLIADVDVLVLTLEESMAGADLSSHIVGAEIDGCLP